MDTRIKTGGYQLTDDIATYLDSRLAAVEKLLAQEADTARLEVEIERAAGKKNKSDYMWRVEVQVVFPDGEVVRATNHAQSVNAAIDDVKDEVLHQLRRRKHKVRAFVKRSGAWVKRLLRSGE